MELGGNAPFLVFEDADIAAAVQGAVQAKMRNAGQTCVAANRFLVHASVAEEFTAGLTAAFDKLVVGHGADEGTTVGPLIEASAVDRVEEVVAEAVDAGARVRIGGDRPDRPGYFYAPTVLDRVVRGPARDHRGDVRPGRPRGDVRLRGRGRRAGELARRSGSSPTRTRATSPACMRLAESVDTGMLGVNRGLVSDASAPFGGVKSSGLGREGGEAGIEEYLDSVYVAI